MTSPEIIIIAALTEKARVIGYDNRLPWYIPDDLKRFKRLTLGHPVLMGRKTFESILVRNGRPLPQRRNLVLSTTKQFSDMQDVEIFASLHEALQAVSQERQVAIIGGESLYRTGIAIADRLELTIVEQEYEGDAFFPDYRQTIDSVFELVVCDRHEGYRFESYRRVQQD